MNQKGSIISMGEAVASHRFEKAKERISIDLGATFGVALQKVPKAYEVGVKKFVEFLKQEGRELDWSGFEAYIGHLKDSYQSARTFNYYLASAKNRLRYLLDNSPSLDTGVRFQIEQAMGKVKGRKVAKEEIKVPEDRCLSPEEVSEFLIRCDKPRVRLWFRFLWVTGCRVSEMLTIRLSRIKLKDHLAHVKVLGKGGKERTVRINRDLLREIRAEFKGKTWLFETPYKQQYQLNLFEPEKKLKRRTYRREHVSQYIAREGKRILGKQISAHTLRHSFATYQVKKAESYSKMKAISEYLGHSSTAITEDMYVHERLTDEDLELFDN